MVTIKTDLPSSYSSPVQKLGRSLSLNSASPVSPAASGGQQFMTQPAETERLSTRPETSLTDIHKTLPKHEVAIIYEKAQQFANLSQALLSNHRVSVELGLEDVERIEQENIPLMQLQIKQLLEEKQQSMFKSIPQHIRPAFKILCKNITTLTLYQLEHNHKYDVTQLKRMCRFEHLQHHLTQGYEQPFIHAFQSSPYGLLLTAMNTGLVNKSNEIRRLDNRCLQEIHNYETAQRLKLNKATPETANNEKLSYQRYLSAKIIHQAFTNVESADNDFSFYYRDKNGQEYSEGVTAPFYPDLKQVLLDMTENQSKTLMTDIVDACFGRTKKPYELDYYLELAKHYSKSNVDFIKTFSRIPPHLAKLQREIAYADDFHYWQPKQGPEYDRIEHRIHLFRANDPYDATDHSKRLIEVVPFENPLKGIHHFETRLAKIGDLVYGNSHTKKNIFGLWQDLLCQYMPLKTLNDDAIDCLGLCENTKENEYNRLDYLINDKVNIARLKDACLSSVPRALPDLKSEKFEEGLVGMPLQLSKPAKSGHAIELPDLKQIAQAPDNQATAIEEKPNTKQKEPTTAPTIATAPAPRSKNKRSSASINTTKQDTIENSPEKPKVNSQKCNQTEPQTGKRKYLFQTVMRKIHNHFVLEKPAFSSWFKYSKKAEKQPESAFYQAEPQASMRFSFNPESPTEARWAPQPAPTLSFAERMKMSGTAKNKKLHKRSQSTSTASIPVTVQELHQAKPVKRNLARATASSATLREDIQADSRPPALLQRRDHVKGRERLNLKK
ncbi:MAG: hypothetical protein VX185_02210 [Pseudomonadota bacterium]|nr:hypothetical protein [Pseudomonadota bacterium]